MKVTLAGADVRAARGGREGESLIYPNAYRDADALLKSLPTGAQFAVSVRGPQAPETYAVRLTLRDSDRLVATAPGAAGPRQGPEGGAVVLRDGQVVVSVSPPVAVDANGATVAVRTEIAGSQLVYRLAHRDKTVAYPLLLDPYVAEDQRYWLGQPPAPTPPSPNPAPDFNGWTFDNPSGLVGGLQGDGGFGRGLNLFTSGNTTFPTGGVIGSWIYQAPYVPAFEAEGARIVKADFGYTGHQRSLFGGSSAMLQSIFNRQLNRPENGFVRGSDPNGFYAAYQSPIFGFIVSNDEGTPGNRATYPYRVHCLSVCNAASPAGTETLGSPGNQARLGLFQSAGRPGFRGANVFMGSSLIFLTEQAAPRITTSGAPSATTWTKDPFTLAATVNDYGLGPRDANFSAPGATGLPTVVQGSPCTGAGVGGPQGGTPGSANQGDRNHRCTAPLTLQAPSSSLADGSYNIAVNATDILSNAGGASVPVKLDRQAPTIALSGTLYDARDGFVGPTQDVTLQAVATDGSVSPSTAQRSGASSVTATLDGQPMTNSPVSLPCTRPEGSCTLTLSTTLTASQLAELDPGEHTIVVTAADALGQGSAQTFKFAYDDVAPSVFSADSLIQLAGRKLTEDGYRLRVEARDNQPFQAEVDDDGEETPLRDEPGAGLRDLVIRLDGASVQTTATACFDDPACEDARVWSWDTTGVSNGPHTISITAADKAGNQTVDEVQVDLQRAADAPPRTNSALRRTVQGAAAGDRAGSAVAAVGDVNGDGYADYLVGAPGVSASGRGSAGAAYLVLGSADSSTLDLASPGTATRRLLGPGSGQFCGTSVAAAGDINGDGLGDMLVGCPGLDSQIGALSATGRVYVVFGRPDPIDVDLASVGAAGFVVTGPTDVLNLGLPLLTARPAVFGERLSSLSGGQVAPDLNDDGLADLVIGDSAVASGGTAAAGAVYVIYGKTDSQTVDATALGDAGYTIRGNVANSLTGYSAVITDDVTGDSLPDIVIGAPGTTAGVGGRAYIVKGDVESGDVNLAAPGERAVMVTSGVTNDRFGVNVTALNDTSLDDDADVAIGTSSGAYILRGIPNTSRQVTVDDGFRVAGPTNTPALLSTQVPEAVVGATADLDGDERADLVVGYPDATGARAYTIRSPEFSRTISVPALPGQRGAAITVGTQGERSGAAVAGNSYLGVTPVSENAQVILGAPNATKGLLGIGAGRAYLLAEPTPVGPGVEPDTEPDEAGGGGAQAGRASLQRAAPAPLRDGVPGLFKIDVADDTRWVTVRNDAQLLVIGNARDNAPFLVQFQKRGRGESVDGEQKIYFHGKLGRNVSRCGWVLADKAVYVAPSLPILPPPCNGRPRRLAPKAFARLINCDQCPDGSPVKLRRMTSAGQQKRTEAEIRAALPDEIPFYRNVHPGTKEGRFDRDGTFPTVRNGERTTVNWRYVSKSGQFVMVRSPKEARLFGNNKWAFIERKYLPSAFIKNGLCDDGTDFKPRKAKGTRVQQRGDWAPVCSDEKFNVPDLPPQ